MNDIALRLHLYANCFGQIHQHIKLKERVPLGGDTDFDEARQNFLAKLDPSN